MSKISTAIYTLKHDKKTFFASLVLCFGFLFPNEVYLRLLFWLKVGYKLDFTNPKTYNEKLQWLKLYYHKPEFHKMVDKFEVKELVAKLIGPEFIIPTYGIWDSIRDIEWEALPNQFVLKTTHGGGGGGIVICKDRESFKYQEAKKVLRRSYCQDIYRNYREWPYKGLKKRIIAEKYIQEEGSPFLHDYKVMCFNGKAKLIEYHEGRYTSQHTQDFYDTDWNLTSITQGSYGLNNTIVAERPVLLEQMISLSEVLAKGLPHIRVDWYIVNNRLYFGELTFFDGSGLCPFDKYEDDLMLGSWIDEKNG